VSNQDNKPVEDESAALRAELARVQEAARRALSDLRGEVDYLRETQHPDRDADSITSQLALEQELDTLRRSLREKERLVDETSAQCRRLEDDLEDQHLAYEAVIQDLERNRISLSVTREQVARLSKERQELEKRYQTMLPSTSSGKAPGGAAAQSRFGKSRSGAQFVGGLVAGILVAVVATGVWVRSDMFSSPDTGREGEQAIPRQAPARPARPEASLGRGADPGSVTGEGPSQPKAPVEVRDRLRDGSFGPWLLPLKGGDFLMGRRLALPEENEGPAHEVRVGGFLIGATEVTFAEYDRFARATGRRFPRDFGWGRGRRPVVDVNWEEASAYVQWLSQRTGRRYRLPSESEWEYAAAAAQDSFFWWGNEPGKGRAVCFDCGTRWDDLSSAPVGTFEPNQFGLYDTTGNVMEWVADCYHPNYLGAPVDGSPWEEKGCSSRVARGGAFNKPAASMRTTARQSLAPDTRLNALGFRAARDE